MTDRDASPTRTPTQRSRVQFTGRIMQVLYSFDPIGMPWKREDLEDVDLVGTPVCIEPDNHATSTAVWFKFSSPDRTERIEPTNVGEVTKNYVDKSGYMWIEAEVLVPHDSEYRGLHARQADRMGKDRGLLPLSRILKYVSLCEKPVGSFKVETWKPVEPTNPKKGENMPSEIFVYLGLVSSVHFFIHTVVGDFNTAAVEGMCGQVYGCMIHETMIKHYQKVAVFNLWKSDEWLVCFVDHVAFPHFDNLTIEDLKTSFFRLLKAQRKEGDGVMTIQYDGTKYSLYEFGGKLPTFQGIGESSPMGELSIIHSSKRITYL